MPKHSMSFGYSVSDFLAILTIAKGVYEACRDGPAEYRELCSETKSMRYTIQHLYDDARDPNSLLNRKGINRKCELDDVIRNCHNAMKEMQALVDKHSRLSKDGRGGVLRIWDAYQVGSCDLDSLRGKLTFYTSMISMFLLSLEGSAIARIESKLDKIYARMVEDDLDEGRGSFGDAVSTVSTISEIETREDDVWAILKRELLEEGISIAHIMANKESIIKHVKLLLEEDPPFNVPDDCNDEIDLLPAETDITPMFSHKKNLLIDYKYPGIKLVLEIAKTGTFRDHAACFLGFVLHFSPSAAAAPGTLVYTQFRLTTPGEKTHPICYQKQIHTFVQDSIIKIVEHHLEVPFIADDCTIVKTGLIEFHRGGSQTTTENTLRRGRSTYRASWNVPYLNSDKDTYFGVRLGLVLLHDNKPFVGTFQIGGRPRRISRKDKRVLFTQPIIEGISDFALNPDDLERYVREGVYPAEIPELGVRVIN